jgi:hypothetical protein
VSNGHTSCPCRNPVELLLADATGQNDLHPALRTVAVKPFTGYPDRAIAQTQRGPVMRAFVFACIGAIAIAIIGAVVLGSIQESADQAFSTSAVRLGH